jgi:hypothetical protein
MKFSDNDLQVLTNFSQISGNIKFEKGKIIQTISKMKNLVAKYQLDTSITENFCLYELGEFLNIYDLYEEPTISIIEEISNQDTYKDNKSLKKILIKDKRFTSEYTCCDESLITYPQKNPEDSIISRGLEYQFNFHISKNDIKDINRIRSKTSTDNSKYLTFENKEGNISIKVHDKYTRNRQISFLLSGDSFLKNKTNHKFKLLLESEMFNKILVGDYYVECVVLERCVEKDSKNFGLRGGLIKLTSMNLPLTYFIACEYGCEFEI